MKKRALLLSGGLNQALDHVRYRNDVAAFYRILRDIYQYEENDIRICLGSGYPLSVGGQTLATLRAGKQIVVESLNWLVDLDEGDRAFLMVTDHGHEGGISLWGKNQSLSPSELNDIFDASPAFKILVLGQCKSGIFGNNAPKNSIVCCACAATEDSYPTNTTKGVQPSYDEFLYQLAGALGGVYPDGDALDPIDPAPPPGKITIAEAFRYARDHDRRFCGSQEPHETPKMFDEMGSAAKIRL